MASSADFIYSLRILKELPLQLLGPMIENGRQPPVTVRPLPSVSH